MEVNVHTQISTLKYGISGSRLTIKPQRQAGEECPLYYTCVTGFKGLEKGGQGAPSGRPHTHQRQCNWLHDASIAPDLPVMSEVMFHGFSP